MAMLGSLLAVLAGGGRAESDQAPLECSAAWAGYGLETDAARAVAHRPYPTGANWSGFGPTQRREWRAVLDINRAACRRNYDPNASAYWTAGLDANELREPADARLRPTVLRPGGWLHGG